MVLGDGCALGPGAHVIGRTTLGAGCRLLAGAVVGSDDPGSTVLGDGNVVGHYALVGVKCQDLKYKNGEECFLEIGNNNDIREAAQASPSLGSVYPCILSIMCACKARRDFCFSLLGMFCITNTRVFAQDAADLRAGSFNARVDPWQVFSKPSLHTREPTAYAARHARSLSCGCAQHSRQCQHYGTLRLGYLAPCCSKFV